MTLLYLGIIIVLLQSYIRLQCRYNDLKKEHSYLKYNISKMICEIASKCKKDIKPL
jgi:hypothetical protein